MVPTADHGLPSTEKFLLSSYLHYKTQCQPLDLCSDCSLPVPSYVFILMIEDLHPASRIQSSFFPAGLVFRNCIGHCFKFFSGSLYGTLGLMFEYFLSHIFLVFLSHVFLTKSQVSC